VAVDLSRDIRDVLFYLEESEVVILQEYLMPLSLQKGEVLFEVDTSAGAHFFICKGSLAVRKYTGFDDKMQVIALLDSGTSVAECGILEGHHHSATVFAIEDSHLMKFPATEYRKLKAEHPQIAIKLLERFLYLNGARLDQCTARLAHIL